MARVFDVIEYPNEMRDEIVHRFPEEGPGTFRIGSQLIVRESQSAVFFRDGNALDVFGPGRHTIVTYNIPTADQCLGKIIQRAVPVPGGGVLYCHARVCRSEVGNCAAYHRSQSKYGPRGCAPPGIWNVQLPGAGSAAIRHPGRRNFRLLSHHRDRNPATRRTSLEATGSVSRNSRSQ